MTPINELFESIYNETIVHHSFLDKKSVLECIRKAYYLGKNEEKEKYEGLKKDFESLMEDWRNSSKYNSSLNLMGKDWDE